MSSLSTNDIELNPTGVHHDDDTQIQKQSVRFSKQFIKFRLSDKERVEYENIYQLFTGGEKNISAKEMGRVMKKLGIHCSEEELDDMIEVVDKDGYGLIHKKHFMNLMTQKVKETSEDKNAEIFETAFSLFDQNKDGRLGMSDIRSIMLNIGEKVCDGEIEEMLAAANLDVCSSEGVTYADFLKLLGQS